MTDKFITELTSASGLALTDMLPLEQQTTGTPETRKMTYDHFLDYNFWHRYKINVSASAGTLTLSITDTDTVSPSATNILPFRIGNVRLDANAALSKSYAAGVNYFNMGSTELAAQDVDLFVYMIAQGGTTLKFGLSRIPYAETMADFTNGLTTPTGEKAIVGTYTTYTSTDPVTNIGRVRARLSAGAGYTWTVPNSVIINRPVYETGCLLFQATINGAGGTIGTFAETNSMSKYIIRGRFCRIDIVKQVTNKGSWTGNVRMIIPMAGASDYSAGIHYPPGVYASTGAPTTPKAFPAVYNTTTMQFLDVFNSSFLDWTELTVNDPFIIHQEYQIG